MTLMNRHCYKMFILLLQTSITGSGSANNLTLSKDQSPNISSNNVAPPLPPHRTCPAPPPPIRQTSIVCITIDRLIQNLKFI